jgi:hypothetical protein
VRWVGAIEDDAEAVLGGIFARALERKYGVLGVGAYEGDRLRLRIEGGSNLEKALGEFHLRVRPIGLELEITVIV